MKLWQKIVVGLGLFGAFVTVGWQVLQDDGIKITSDVLMVDVTTGDLFSYPIKKKHGSMIPEKNPDTGQYTLFPVYLDDDGAYYVADRYIGSFRDLEAEPAAVDPNSRRVTVSGNGV